MVRILKKRPPVTVKNKKAVKEIPEDLKTVIAYKSTELWSKFPVKDKTDFYHKNNVAYQTKYPNEGCKDDYVGETNWHIAVRIKGHNIRKTFIYLGNL